MSIKLETDMKLDYGFITNLAYKEFAKYFQSDRKNSDDITMWMMTEPKTRTITAYSDSEPAGYCIHSPVPSGELISYKCYLEELKEEKLNLNCRTVLAIAVSDKFKKKGIGQSMLEETIKQCKKMKTKQIFATCTEAHKGSSLYLFKKCGFEEIITLPQVWPNGSPGTIVYKNLI